MKLSDSEIRREVTTSTDIYCFIFYLYSMSTSNGPKYSMEYWEFDFLADHLLNNEDLRFYDEEGDYAEIIASTERKGSTVIFHGKRDSSNAWFEVFSLDEGEHLGRRYLEEMTDRRVDSIGQRSRETYGI